MDFNKIDELETRLGRDLDDRELSAILTVIDDGNSPLGMDFQEACEVVHDLTMHYELPQFC